MDEINPLDYNKKLKLSIPYKDNGWVDYEDFEFTSLMQTVFVKKLRKYRFYNKHIVLFNTDSGNGICNATYSQDIDFTIDYTRSEITRIQSSDGGTIPSGTAKMRILFLKNDSNDDFESKCFRTFSNNKIILSDNAAVPIYPAIPVVVMDKYMNKIYQVGIDYEISYSTNTITIIQTGSLVNDQTVFVTYADYWEEDGDCEEKIILNSIKNKKVLCVDNHIKDTKYSTFDLVATVYCYKSLKGKVKDTVPDLIREQFNIDSARYNYPISKAEIISFIMNQTGVRFVDIDYLGKDYNAYRKYVQEEITLSELNNMDANKVEHKIIPKYNEIFVLSWDEYDGIEVQENQRHGLILKFEEA